MPKLIVLPFLIVLMGCSVHDPNDGAGRLSREFAKGEKLMIKCQENERKCPAYYEFKAEWEREVRHYTTFEAALAKHKARTAQGYAV
ncbi:hypothetical protein [uncultured Shimia sp.]|uniref:hypothetical protein n=1 Tax=uncultured Shimia sp. TaxID=573152 RepID=UPI00260638CB|nr:hypothetical protein [uncultured Shimia sp.]